MYHAYSKNSLPSPLNFNPLPAPKSIAIKLTLQNPATSIAELFLTNLGSRHSLRNILNCYNFCRKVFFIKPTFFVFNIIYLAAFIVAQRHHSIDVLPFTNCKNVLYKYCSEWFKIYKYMVKCFYIVINVRISSRIESACVGLEYAERHTWCRLQV